MACDEEGLVRLAEFNIVPAPEVNGFVCAKCRSELSCTNEQSFTSHMKNFHKIIASKRRELFSLMASVKKGFNCSSEKADYYRGILQSREPLPRLEGLDVENTKRCPKCIGLFQSAASLKSHMRDDHGVNSFFKKEWNALPDVKAQRLTKKKGKSFFFPIRTNEISEANSPMRGVESPNMFRHLLEDYDPSQVINGKTVPFDIREHTPFMAVLKPQSRLRRYNIDKENAVMLSAGVLRRDEFLSNDFCRDIGNRLANYYEEARSLCDVGEIFPGTFLDVATPGGASRTKHFSFLRKDSRGFRLEKYVQFSTALILMACRICEMKKKNDLRGHEIPFNQELEKAVSSLMQETRQESPDAMMLLHDVLYEIFFEEGNDDSGPGRLFAYAYATCICVTAKRNEVPRFRIGTEVSEVISGPLHIVSCVALMATRRFNKNDLDKTAKVRRCLEVGAKSGVGVLVDLRSQCSKIRTSETGKFQYIVCDIHENCGFLNGTEASAEMIGQLLRKLQQAIRQGIFGSNGLFNGNDLPLNFRVKIDTMTDRVSEKKVGYWFASDPTNREVLNTCKNWLSQFSSTVTNLREMERWAFRAKKIAEYLLCAIHISGGAPGRGTELGVASIINKVCGRRTLFFVGAECVIVPYYNKTRVLKEGNVNFITRHLDKETTYLLKLFLLLVHPVACLHEDEVHRSSAKVTADAAGDISNWENFVDTAKMDKRWSTLCDVNPSDVSAVINSVLEEHGLPLNFSEYRQWQCGYAKNRGSTSMKLATEVAWNSQSLEGTLPKNGAAILQAGHSIRTAEEIYARMEDALKGKSGKSSDIELRLFQKASYDWHEDLKVREKRLNLPAPRENVSKASTVVSACNASLQSPDGKAKHYLQLAIREAGFCRAISLMGEIGQSPTARESPAQLVQEQLNLGAVEEQDLQDFNSGSLQAPDVACDPNSNVEFNSLVALKKACGISSAEFRRKEQKTAMEAVYREKKDLAIILGTGSGKTAVVLGPVMFEKQITLWISPLKSLREECREKFESLGVKTSTIDITNFTEPPRDVQIMLISPENMPRKKFLDFLRSVSAYRQKVRRVVIDEAHELCMSDDFRECMPAVKSIRDSAINIPFVLLTATAPKALLRRIISSIGAIEKEVRVIRGDCSRRNLRLSVQQLPSCGVNVLIEHVLTTVQRICTHFSSGTAKIIVACLTRKDADNIYESIDKSSYAPGKKVCKHHSAMDRDCRTHSIKSWNIHARGVLIMVATDGFLTGIDSGNVRAVVFAGAARSLVSFWQAAGRAGRDNREALISVLFHSGHLLRATGGKGSQRTLETGCFEGWASETTKCLRKPIEDFFNERKDAQECWKRPDCVNCRPCDDLAQNSTWKGQVARTQSHIDTTDVFNSLPSSESCPMMTNIDGRCTSTPEKRTFEDMHGKRKDKRQRTTFTLSTSGQMSIMDERCSTQDGAAYDAATEIALLRKKCQFLFGSCMLCVVEDGLQEQGFRLKVHEHSMNNCVKYNMKHWKNGKSRCFRCLQIGHSTKHCEVVEAPKIDGRKCCAGCFLYLYNGVPFHRNEVFSRDCALSAATTLVLSMWGKCNERTKQEMSHALLPSGTICTDIEFGNWLLRDKAGTPCGITKAFNWVAEKLKLFDGIQF